MTTSKKVLMALDAGSTIDTWPILYLCTGMFSGTKHLKHLLHPILSTRLGNYIWRSHSEVVGCQNSQTSGVKVSLF
jgi:hypothetical protein